MKELSDRAYESILRRAKENALKVYREMFDSDLQALLKNHISVEETLGTESDNDGRWRVDPTSLTDKELMQELSTLSRKLSRITAENEELVLINNDNTTRLERILQENRKLEIIRDTQ